MISVLTYFCSQQITHVPTQTKTSKSFTALELRAQNVQKKKSVKTREEKKVVKTTNERVFLKRQKITAHELPVQNVQQKIPSKQRRKKIRQNNAGRKCSESSVVIWARLSKNARKKLG